MIRHASLLKCSTPYPLFSIIIIIIAIFPTSYVCLFVESGSLVETHLYWYKRLSAGEITWQLHLQLLICNRRLWHFELSKEIKIYSFALAQDELETERKQLIVLNCAGSFFWFYIMGSTFGVTAVHKYFTCQNNVCKKQTVRLVHFWNFCFSAWGFLNTIL